MRFFFLLAALLASAIVAFVSGPYVSGNSDAILVLVTIFTVFAGFLVAILTILGDPTLIPAGSWRVAESRRGAIEARLITHAWLFTLYLVTIALLFVGVVLSKVPEAQVLAGLKAFVTWIYLFIGTFAFILTFALPGSILIFQRSRVDAEVERRRREDSIGVDDRLD